MSQSILCAAGVHRWHHSTLFLGRGKYNGISLIRCLHCHAVKELKPIILVEMPTAPKEDDQKTVTFAFNKGE